MSILPVQSASASVSPVVPRGATLTISVSRSFGIGNSAGNTIIVTVAARDGAAGGTVSAPSVTDSIGNSYTQAEWLDGGLQNPAVGIFYATNIQSGANTVTFSVTAVNTNPLFDLTYPLDITITEVPLAPGAIRQASGIQQQSVGNGTLAITLTDSTGTSVTSTAGIFSQTSFAVADFFDGTNNYFIAALTAGSGSGVPIVAPAGYLTYSTIQQTSGLTTSGAGVGSTPADDPKGWLVINEPALGWIDRSNYLHVGDGGQHSFTLQLRQRGQATVEIYIPAGDAYSPTQFTRVRMYDQTQDGTWSRVYSGLIQDVETTWKGNAGDRFVTLTFVSLESVFDTVYAPPQTYVDQTCGFILTDLFNLFETGCPVTLGTISAGAVIRRLVTNYEKISDLFDELATTSEFVWTVDPVTETLFFGLPSVAPAPWTFTETDLLWESTNFKVNGQDYRNRQAIRLNYDAFPHSGEFFVGTGQTTVTLMRPVQQVTNAYATLSTPNTAIGTFNGNAAEGDTITIGTASEVRLDNHIYAIGGTIIDPNGNIQQVTLAGTSGGPEPTWATVRGDTTVDGTVIWTNQGPAGLSTGTDTYVFVGRLDNTQWGQVLIGPNAQTTCRNLVDAINANAITRGSGFSLPTWECAQCNAVNNTGTSFTLQQKAAGTGWFSAISTTSAVFAWNGPASAGWHPNTLYGLGQTIVENGFIQQVSFFLLPPAISGGTEPTWNNTTGATTVDGTLFWTCKGPAPAGGNATVTSGGTSPQGSLGKGQGATISLQVYEQGTNVSGPAVQYKPGSNIIHLATPLNVGSNLNIEYTRADGNVIEVENTDAVTALAAITHGTGKYQQITDASSQGLISTSAEAGLQLAQQALAAYSVPPQVLTLETYRPGLVPGMSLTTLIARPAGAGSILDGEWVTEEINAELVPVRDWVTNRGGHYKYTVRVQNLREIGSYLDFWEGLAGKGGGGGGLAATSGGMLSPDGTTGSGGARVKTDSYTLVAGDSGLLIVYDSITPGTFTLPGAPPFGTWEAHIENINSGALTVFAGSRVIDSGPNSLTINKDQGVYLTTDGQNYFTERGLAAIPAGIGLGNGNGNEYQQEPRGVRDGVNVDFFLDFIPSLAPTGNPPRVPFELDLNGAGQSAYHPDYFLSPGSNHLQMVRPPKATDWGFECRYIAGQSATGVTVVPPGVTGGGPSGTPGTIAAVQSPASTSTVHVPPGGQIISVSIALSANLAGSTLVVLVGGISGGPGDPITTPVVTDTNNVLRGPYHQACWVDGLNEFLPGVGIFYLDNVAAGANTVTFSYHAGNTNPFFGLDFQASLMVVEFSGIPTPVLQTSGTQQSNSPGGLVSVSLVDSHGATITTAGNSTSFGAIAVADLVFGGADLWLAGYAMDSSLAPVTPTGTGFTYGSLGVEIPGGPYWLELYSPALPLVTLTSAPTITPNGATFPDALHTVTISAPAGSTIYFTTDGSTPTKASRVYLSPILISTSLTIKAFSVDQAGTVSSIVSASFTVAVGTPPVPTVSGSPEIFWKIAPSSNSYLSAASTTDKAFVTSHVHRTMVYPDAIGSGVLVWNRNTWFYRDSSSLYHPGNDADVLANPSWILRDSAGRAAYIKFGPQYPDGTYAQYAPDYGDAGFRAWWIAQARIQVNAGFFGVWIDDVNLDMNLANETGDVTPMDPRTGSVMTPANYQQYLVEFLELVRASFAGSEIAHNALYWNAGGNPSANPLLARQIQACDFYNIERGFDDPGIVGGFGKFGLRTIFDFIDQIHGLGGHFIAEQTPGVNNGDYYPLACDLAMSDGADMYQVTEGGLPPSWPPINYVDLGSPIGARFDSGGLIQRNFANGTVLIAEPGGSGTVALGGNFIDPAGNTISSVTLASRQGTILQSSDAFSQIVARMSVLRDYKFGSGAGRNITNLTDLAAHFDPYGIAGTTVINNEWERYQPFNTTNHAIGTGSIKITASIPVGGGLFNGGINSGQFWTQETFQPGVTGHAVYAIEASIRIPGGKGMWPAFWCYTKDPTPGVADSSEIDMFEFFEGLPGNDATTMSSNIHGPGVGATRFSLFNGSDLYVPGIDFSTALHKFQWIWTTTQVSKYVDGVLVRVSDFAWTANGPAQIGVNLACGSDLSGLPGLQPDSLGEFPAAVEVEHLTIWVRDGNQVLLSSFGPGGTGGDDTALLQAAINSTAAANQQLIVDYVSQPLNTNPLNLPTNTNIFMNTGAIIQARSGYTALQVMLTIDHADNVTLAGPGIFRMLKSEYVSGEFRHCLGLYSATNVSISNLQFNDSGGDGMYISGATDTVTVTDSIFNNNRRNGLSIISGSNVSFTRCSFTSTNGTAPEAGIDLEPNGTTDQLVNIQFTDCTSSSNNGNGVLVDPRNLHASSAAVSATFLRHASQSNGNSGFQVTNEQDGLTGTTGTITFQNCTSHLEQFYAFKANFYNSSGPQVHVTNLSAVNPNRSGGTVDNAAVGIVRGGGGSGPIGNIIITGLSVSQTGGGLVYYFTLSDASGPSYATIQILSFGSLSGASGGSNGVQDGVAKTSINIP